MQKLKASFRKGGGRRSLTEDSIPANLIKVRKGQSSVRFADSSFGKGALVPNTPKALV